MYIKRVNPFIHKDQTDTFANSLDPHGPAHDKASSGSKLFIFFFFLTRTAISTYGSTQIQNTPFICMYHYGNFSVSNILRISHALYSKVPDMADASFMEYKSILVGRFYTEGVFMWSEPLFLV